MPAVTAPARANCPALPGGVCFDISGGSGADGHHGNDYLGDDGQIGGYADRGHYSLPSTINATGAAAATIQSNGGDGGWGDRSRPSYGWGGNGGPGGGLHVNGTGTTVTNSAGYGIDIWARGGSGGPSAINAGENDYDGRDRGSGAAGGVVVVDLNGITTTTQASGIRINVDGGTGANGAIRPVTHNPRGGPGGNGGQIIATISGNLTTTGNGGDGAITLSANGGTAGDSAGDGGGGWPRSGGDGGLGGTITLNFSGTIRSQRYGIYAESRGGAGGDAAQDSHGNDYQTPGGYGSAGGNIALTLGPGLITVTSDNVDAVFATSTGGRGGNGGSSHPGNPHTGKAGGNGGSSGSIAIDSAIGIETHGTNSIGINAIVAGGLGGAGGSDSGIIYSKGGAGGRGGSEADLKITQAGSITTHGDNATGVLARSLGGGGAVGGGAIGGIVSIGGSGANGGLGGLVHVITRSRGTTNAPADDFIHTSGKQAHAIAAESTGGGGGNGGRSFAIGVLPFTLSIGGSGGGGGAGGQVIVENGQALTTSGSQSHAIFAQSTGGGGGNGGVANLASVSAGFNFSLALGGSGGGGGAGAKVTVTNAPGIPIVTSGSGSFGIFAQSVGGGGGTGGSALSDQLTLPIAGTAPPAFNMALGGKGGGGGDGDAVTVTNDGTISTAGAQSPAIFAHSVGGGGGHGGISTAGTVAVGGSFPWSASFAIGGTGGGGGHGGSVTVTHQNTNGAIAGIRTAGDASDGIYAQSVGGGGGKGGLASNLGIYTAVTTKVGGNGGGYGNGGIVTVSNFAQVFTHGKGSRAIFAESIGGGGGSGGGSSGLGLGVINIGVGGNAGGGGSGNQVDVVNGNGLLTSGTNADAIFAHSAGGGGGDAMVTQQISVGAAINAAIAVGGSGGGGGHGGAVQVRNLGGLTQTGGTDSRGIFAQSVGGGGGNGGAAWSGQIVAGVPNPSHVSSAAFNIALGGTGGSGGDGGTVAVSNGATIRTLGARATAIFAQSLGGGGGSGGTSTAGTVIITPAAGTAPDQSFGVSETLAIGGKGGGGGKGGAVTVANTDSLTTHGDNALGIFAQSIGGGGGNGGNAIESAGAISLGPGAKPNQPDGGTPKNFSFTLGQAVGGTGGNGNVGGDVIVTHDGWIVTGGAKATGIFAQSIGGGGGNGGSSQGLSSAVTTFASTTTVGGKGGTGNHGGTVTVNSGLHQNGIITTAGIGSAGIFAQSIGGGGGNGGNASHATGSIFQSAFSDVAALQRLALFLKDDKKWSLSSFQVAGNLGITVGGSGGAGGNGGNVSVTSANAITTSGLQSPGIFAQSVGGGGGNGGSADALSEASLAQVIVDGLATMAGSLKKMLSPSANFGLTVSVGGSGGAGGSGGVVTVENRGTVSTSQDDSPGLLAQSIGGGGGNGSSASKGLGDAARDLGIDTKTFQEVIGVISQLPWNGSWTRAFSVGGSGGAAGDGGTVSVVNGGAAGTIRTLGANSEGIFAQSIGGGGGNGAHADPLAGAATFALNTEIGGKGSGGGKGGTVSVTNGGRIETSGVNSIGVLAQSIGGGGGKSSQTFGGGLSGFNPAWGANWYSALGASGASGHGGTVTVDNQGGIVTHGALAHGIVAQSIGNGGGIALLTLGDPAPDGAIPKLPALSASSVLGASGTSAHGDGGNAVVKLSGAIQTSGFAALGVIAQSIGNGGGYSAIGSGSGLASAATLTLGASGSATGAGGEVDVTIALGGQITTQGRNAIGVLAQSIGGGGGVAALTSTSHLITLARPSTPAAGGGGNLNVAVNGHVQTTGDGAIGVLAQSIGGGGGLAGDLASASYGLGLVKERGLGGTGAGGHVVVNVSGVGAGSRNSGIVTRGVNAPAILAMSLADGGVLTDQGLLARKPSGNGTAAGAIGITVDKSATVAAHGTNSPGIYAISRGRGATGVNGGDITITVGEGSTVQGGSGSRGAAIVTDTIGSTTITNSGTITALSGVAIATNGPANLTNATGSTINGNIRLAVDAVSGPSSQFNNNGDFSPGTEISLGGNGVLTNSGYMDLTAPIYGHYDTTRLTGQFVQTASGTTIFGLDFKAGKNDVLSVSGATQFGGEIDFDTQNPLKGRSLTIAHFDQGAQGFTAKTGDLNDLPITYALQLSPDRRDLSVSAQGNFANAASAFPSDKARIGSYLQAIWDSGNEDAAALFTYFARLNDAAGYAGMLGDMANDASHSRAAAQAHHAYSFFNSLMSCPYFVDSGTQRNEGECVWGRATGNRIDRDGTRDDSGYRSLMSTYQVGAQKQIAPDWFLGGSLSYMTGDTKSDGAAMSATSHTVSGGLALKRQMGPWLFAAGLRAGYEDTDVARRVILPGFAGLARSSPQFLHLGARLRAAYEFAFPNWYLRPFADLDISYVHQQAYRESGAGLFDLAALSASRTSVMATPGLEIGSRIELGETTLRPYAIAGISFLANGGWAARMHLAEFAGSGIAPFRMTTGAPKTYGNLSAGLELQTKSGFELRAEYSLRAATRYTDHTASVRAALRF